MTDTTPESEPVSDVYEPDILSALYNKRIRIYLQHVRAVNDLTDEILAAVDGPYDKFTKAALLVLFDEVQKITEAEGVVVQKLLDRKKQRLEGIAISKKQKKEPKALQRVK